MTAHLLSTSAQARTALRTWSTHTRRVCCANANPLYLKMTYFSALVFPDGHRPFELKLPTQAHESYHGERTAESISNFALQVLKEVIAGDPELQASHAASLLRYVMPRH